MVTGCAAVRELCIFARQKVMAEVRALSWESDLISCPATCDLPARWRNRRVHRDVFDYAAQSGGFLVWANRRRVGEHTELFGVVEQETEDFFPQQPRPVAVSACGG